MQIQVELDTYKSLVMLLESEEDELGKVIRRLLKERSLLSQVQNHSPQYLGPGYWYMGNWYRSNYAIDVYVNFLETMDRRIANFCGEFAKACSSIGNYRPYIARNREDLYPGRTDLQQFAKPLGDWWVDGNTNTKQKKELMHLAAKVVGLDDGVDYRISL